MCFDGSLAWPLSAPRSLQTIDASLKGQHGHIICRHEAFNIIQSNNSNTSLHRLVENANIPAFFFRHFGDFTPRASNDIECCRMFYSLAISYGTQACACFGSCFLRSSQDKQPSEPSSGPQFVKGIVDVGRPVSGLIKWKVVRCV